WSPQVSWTRVRPASVAGRRGPWLSVCSDGISWCACAGRSPGRLKGLIEVFDEVIDVLQSRRDPDQPGADASAGKASLVELRVRSTGRMGDAGLGVAQVHQP